ncbi:MAG: hypothetical protein HC841_09035 [Verrucomicrobiae bacterium]|nr:hypothetical protein [Verrucomicrobiae bacterium]
MSAAFDGTVSCHAGNGTPRWQQKINSHFPFDLAVADIDNDGLDEVFVATGGGTLDAYDSDGTPLWTFQSKAQLYRVCPVQTSPGRWVILTGGVEKQLFSVSTGGTLVKKIPAENVVRHIRKGNILGDGREYAAVTTTSSGRNGRLSLLLVDVEDLTVLWKQTGLDSKKELQPAAAVFQHDRF